MDPLSVGASVTGLLVAGIQAGSILFRLITRTKNAPSFVRSLLMELKEVAAILSQLEEYVLGTREVDSKGASLVPLKQLVSALTSCVITYSDLQAQLDKMKPADVDSHMGLLSRVAWVRKEASFCELIQRLQRHKSTLTLMMTVLQGQQLRETENNLFRLVDIDERILILERDAVARSASTLRLGDTRMQDRRNPALILEESINDRSSTIQTSTTRDRIPLMSTIPRASHAIQSRFERDLQLSHVYRRAWRRSNFSLNSINSAALYSTSMSLLSNLSWSQASNVSFYALPVFTTDLSNSYCYEFGEQEPDAGCDNITETTKTFTWAVVDEADETTLITNRSELDEFCQITRSILRNAITEKEPTENDHPEQWPLFDESDLPLHLQGRQRAHNLMWL